MHPATTRFRLSRFMRLLRAHWAERHRGYAMFWLVVAAVHALLMLILLAADNGRGGQTDVQAVVFWCGLIASGVVFASLHFAALRKPGSALLLLTRPASVFEKWLLAVLFALLAWPLAYTVSATLINACAGALGYQMDWQHHLAQQYGHLPESRKYAVFIPLFGHASDPGYKAAVASHMSILSIYTGLSGFALLGSVYFRKNAGIKTGVLAFVIFLLTILLAVLVDSITNHRLNPEFLFWWNDVASPAELLPRKWIANLLMWLLVPALAWIGALFALREKDMA